MSETNPERTTIETSTVETEAMDLDRAHEIMCRSLGLPAGSSPDLVKEKLLERQKEEAEIAFDVELMLRYDALGADPADLRRRWAEEQELLRSQQGEQQAQENPLNPRSGEPTDVTLSIEALSRSLKRDGFPD